MGLINWRFFTIIINSNIQGVSQLLSFLFFVNLLDFTQRQKDYFNHKGENFKLFFNSFSKFLCLSCSKVPELFKTLPTFAISVFPSSFNHLQSSFNHHKWSAQCKCKWFVLRASARRLPTIFFLSQDHH